MAQGNNNNDSTRRVVRIGVFIPTEAQLLDQAPVDIFASMSHEYLRLLSKTVPQHVIDLAPSAAIHYIGSVKAGEPIPLTANQRILATNHYSDAEVAPGRLDIVLVPGPDPNTDWDGEHAGALGWLRAHAGQEGTDVLCVCTGIFLCGAAGLLEGKTACGPRGLQDAVKEKFGTNMTLRGAELRWVQDGNFWSSGGITNGNDLVMAYARSSRHFPRPIVELTADLLDVGDRAQEYSKGQARFMMGLGYTVIWAWFAGLFGKK